MRGPKRLAHTATAGLKRLHPHEVQLRCAYAATAGAGLRCAEKWRLRVAMKQEQELGLWCARGDVVVSQLARRALPANNAPAGTCSVECKTRISAVAAVAGNRAQVFPVRIGSAFAFCQLSSLCQPIIASVQNP